MHGASRHGRCGVAVRVADWAPGWAVWRVAAKAVKGGSLLVSAVAAVPGAEVGRQFGVLQAPRVTHATEGLHQAALAGGAAVGGEGARAHMGPAWRQPGAAAGAAQQQAGNGYRSAVQNPLSSGMQFTCGSDMHFAPPSVAVWLQFDP